MDERLEGLQRRAAADPRVIALAGGLPNEAQFPRRALALSFLRALRQAGTPALQYGWAEGSERLRAFVADRLRARGADVAAADVLITSGAQQAIAIALELTCRAGDQVAVDAETYPAALDLLRARRLRPVAGASALEGARIAYAMPAIGNPRGLALDAAARRALLDGGLPIIEDDAYADLRFDGPAPRPLLADAPARVLHVGTLSKTLCPGLRIGWLVAPRALRRPAVALKQGGDLQASSLAQAVAEHYLAGGTDGPGVDFDARLTRLRRFYRRRAALLARALRTHLPGWHFEGPEGGFAIWAQADGAADEVDLLEQALAAGVSVDPGSTFRPSAASTPTALRLCFSLPPATALDEGVRRLAAAWQRARRARVNQAPRPRS
jgi:2-aminoadipate transaminase